MLLDPFCVVPAVTAAGPEPQPHRLRWQAVGAAVSVRWDIWELWAGCAALTARPKVVEPSHVLTTARLTSDSQLLQHLDVKMQPLQTEFEAQLVITEAQHLPTLLKAYHSQSTLKNDFGC